MTRRCVLVTVLAITSGLTLAAPHSGAAAHYARGYILVKFKQGVSQSTISAAHRSAGSRLLAEIPHIGIQRVSCLRGRELVQVARYSVNRNVEFATTDAVVPPSDITPNDPYYMYQAGLRTICAPAAWSTTTGSPTVTIAILDTGLDATHADLVGNVVAGWNAFDNSSDTRDVLGHGTLVAGTAAARGNNGTGVCSVAWNCKIMPVRVSDIEGYGYASVMADGLVWAADHGARVANISYAMSNNICLQAGAEYFRNRGGVISVAAGNSAYFDPNPDDPYVLTVTATNSSDVLCPWSNTGNSLDLAAPGVTFSTVNGGGYSDVAGTSIAAPVVAGVAALLLSVNPQLAANDVQDILKQSADDLGAAGWDTQYGWGRVNAARAVSMALPPGDDPDTTAPITTFIAPTSGSIVMGTITVSVNATDGAAVGRVDLYVDSVLAGTDTESPYTFAWDTTRCANGSHVLRAAAVDTAGNTGESQTNVVVNNPAPDTTLPRISITSPANGAVVNSTVSVLVNASDNVRVQRVELYVDGRLTVTSTTAPFTTKWNARKAARGAHLLKCRAYDAAGNTADAAITVYR